MPAELKRFLGNRASNPWWIGLPDVMSVAEFTDEDFKVDVVREKILNYTVRLEPVVLQCDGRAVPGQFAPVCSDGYIIPATVGSQFRNYQPASICDIFNAMSKTGEARLHTVGILKERRLIWGLAQIGSDFKIRHEHLKRYMMVWDSFDGSTRRKGKETDVCTVCSNTFDLATRDEGKTHFSISHSGDTEAKMEEVFAMLRQFDEDFKAKASFIEELQQDEMTRAEMRTLACQLLTGIDDRDEATKKVAESTGAQHTIYENKGGELMRCYDEGIGAAERGPTAWRAYGAVLEFIDWQRNRMKNWEHNYSRLTTAGLDSALFGDGNRKKQRALRLIQGRKAA